MKILVPAKRVPDTDQKIQVRADGSGVDTSNLPYVINPFDAIALEEAVRMREGATAPEVANCEIVVVGIGDASYEEQLRTALAMGADRALRVSLDCSTDHSAEPATLDSPPLDPWNVARTLQAVVELEAPDLVLMGKQAVDGDNNQTGQFLAAMLDWPQATFASRIEYAGGGLRVDREIDAGIETIELPLPAVVTVDLRLNEPRYASLPGIMKARKKEIKEISIASLGIERRPRVRVISVRSDKSARKRLLLKDSREFAECLRKTIL